MVDFRCNIGTADLCVINGTCIELTKNVVVNGTSTIVSLNEYGCHCFGSLSADNVFFHFPSCTLPANAYSGFWIYYSIVLIVLVAWLMKEFWTISHRKTRTIVIADVLCLVLTWCQVACCYLQNGAYEGNAVFAVLSFSVTFFLGGRLSISFMETLYAVRRMPMHRFIAALQVCTALACISAVVCGFAMVGTCRGSNASYNIAAWLMEVMLVGWAVVFCAVIFYYANLLLGNVEHASTLRGATNDAKAVIHDLVRKVRALRNAALYNAILLLLVGFPKAVAFLVLGSIPFQWLFGYAFLYQGLIILSCGILVFVRHTKSRKPVVNEELALDVSFAAGASEFANGEHGKDAAALAAGRNGRTWLFRGSSLMITKQGGKEITKQTNDQDGRTYSPKKTPIRSREKAVNDGDRA